MADVILFMLTRPRRMTIRDVVTMPTNFDLQTTLTYDIQAGSVKLPGS